MFIINQIKDKFLWSLSSKLRENIIKEDLVATSFDI